MSSQCGPEEAGASSSQQPARGSEAAAGEKPSVLKASLLEKLSERLAAVDKVSPAPEKSAGDESKEGEEDREMYSPSPVSTVSSSGEQGGVYMLHSDGTHSDEGEQEGSGE